MPDDKTAKDDAVATAKAGKAIAPDENAPNLDNPYAIIAETSFTAPSDPART